MTKYYFVTYQARVDGLWLPENAVIDQHPVEWIIEARKDFPDSQYTMIFWQEVSKEVFDQYCDEF